MSKATKKATAKKATGPRSLRERWKPSQPGTQRRKVHDLYETGMPLKDIAKKLKLKYGNVSGHISNYREGHGWNGTDKTFDLNGNVTTKKTLEKKIPKVGKPVKKKKPGKVKPAAKKKVVKKTTQSKKKVVEAKPKLVNSPKIPAGTKVYEAPEEEDEVEEIPVDEWTGKPMF